MFNLELYEKNIHALIESKYRRINHLSIAIRKMIVDQLSWVQESTQFTPQADVLYQEGGVWQKHLHREIFRALSRIENMLLLHEVNEKNFDALYAEFTVDQLKTDKLSKESFAKLSRQFLVLNPAQIEAQIRASLIAAVTLSPQAIKRANDKLGKDNYPYDSVMFSGKTIAVCGEIYPVYVSAEQEVQGILRACFPDDNRHWRHAFFLENFSCLDVLKEQVGICTPENRDQLKINISVWLNYWLINALGFNGHTGTLQGSSFMTESVFQRTMMLNQVIEMLFDRPGLDVFGKYSNLCLEYLNVTVDNAALAIFVVRALNMANLFNQTDAAALAAYVRNDELLLEIVKHHDDVFKSGKVATYLPGFLQNIFSAVDGDKKFETLLSAIDWTSTIIEHSEAKIVSFRLMERGAIETLLTFNFDTAVFRINDKGEVAEVLVPSPSC